MKQRGINSGVVLYHLGKLIFQNGVETNLINIRFGLKAVPSHTEIITDNFP